MKQLFPALALLSFLTVAPAFGQGTTKLLTAESYFSLDFGTGQPTKGDSTTYAYNSTYQMTETRYWVYLDSATWQLTGRLTDYSYDANGNLLSFIEQKGDDTNGWVDFSRTTNTFDGNNHQLSSVVETWNGTAWLVDETTNWVYDANGKVVSEISDEYRFFYVYNTEGLLETQTQERLITGNWENLFRFLYTYVPNDTKVASFILERATNNIWENFNRVFYTYDANGDAVVTFTESWTNGAWENNGNLLSEYDANHNLVHWVNQSWSGSTWDDFIQLVAEYDDESNILNSRTEFNLGVWTPFRLFGYYYTEFVSTNAPQLADFQIFPNPASSLLMFKSEGLAQVQIFDNKGQLLRSQRLSGQAQETLRVGDLPVGNYFLQVTSTDGKMGAKPLQIRR